MPSNIKINRRYWNQEYSLVRAHIASNDTGLGGQAAGVLGGFTVFDFNNRSSGQWAPPIAAGANLRIPFANTAQIGGGSNFIFADFTANGIAIEIINSGPGETTTSPHTGTSAIICETAPDTIWEFSVKVKNTTGGVPVAGTVDLSIHGLNETGGIVNGLTAVASGSQVSGPASIPNQNTNYFSRANIPATSEIIQLTGFAQFNGDEDIRYLSMRIDVNDPMQVRFFDLELQPYYLNRPQNPLLWNSPRLFSGTPAEGLINAYSNLRWGIASNENNNIGNGTPHEYLRITLNHGLDDASGETADSIESSGLKGWRYGPNHGGSALSNYLGTGGTAVPFPGTGIYDSSFSGGYNYWLLHKGNTPSSATGPINGIPCQPQQPEFPGTQHFGYKRSTEPAGNILDHNYLYVECSNSQNSKRFALQLPKINFNSTTRLETLTFYFHSNGNDMGKLRIFHAVNSNDFFLPEDGTPHPSVGTYELTQLTSINIFAGLDATHTNDYTTVDQINSRHASTAQQWHRAEVDLSSLRGLNTHIILLFDGASGYRSDFAISNILVSGLNNSSDEYVDPNEDQTDDSGFE